MPMKTTLPTQPAPPGICPRRSFRAPSIDLFDDLSGTHVALQAGLPCGAERAGHAASRLAGDTHRDPIRVAHQHALHERTVVHPPQCLDRGSTITGELTDRGQQTRHELLSECLSNVAGQVGPLGRIVAEPLEVVRR